MALVATRMDIEAIVEMMITTNQDGLVKTGGADRAGMGVWMPVRTDDQVATGEHQLPRSRPAQLDPRAVVEAAPTLAALALEVNRWKVSRHGAWGWHLLTIAAEILEYIQQNFDFMTQDKCVPIEIALKLMDPSSLGLADQSDRFQQTHQDLQRALKAIVNGSALPRLEKA
jgi:hypothetical protein